MTDVTSPKEKMTELVARDTSASYRPPSLQGGGAAARCPRCSFPLQGLSEDSSAAAPWRMAPFLRDSLAILGAASAGTVSAVYSFNFLMPRISRRLPKSNALQYAVVVPPVVLLSSIGAGAGAGFLPSLVQVCMSSYYTTSSSTNAAVLSAHHRLTKADSSTDTKS